MSFWVFFSPLNRVSLLDRLVGVVIEIDLAVEVEIEQEIKIEIDI